MTNNKNIQDLHINFALVLEQRHKHCYALKLQYCVDIRGFLSLVTAPFNNMLTRKF